MSPSHRRRPCHCEGARPHAGGVGEIKTVEWSTDADDEQRHLAVLDGRLHLTVGESPAPVGGVALRSGHGLGDVPSWIEAVATVAAFLAAAWAVVRTGDLLKIEQGRDHDRDRETAELRERTERAEQADMVAAWSHVEEGDISDGSGCRGRFSI